MKKDLVITLRKELAAVKALRQAAKMDPTTLATRVALKKFQSQRLAHTHADLLAAEDTCGAAEFFLQELYSPQDLTQRDTDVERIVPTLERLLPVSALQAITDAVILDALSEQMDAAMADHLGCDFTELAYIDAFRTQTSLEQRRRQLELVNALGGSLCVLVKIRFLSTSLVMMRAPARMAGLGGLQCFLERGFSTFKAMRKPRVFLQTITQRENLILERIFAGSNTPFVDVD
jgi:hypothetical protein